MTEIMMVKIEIKVFIYDANNPIKEHTILTRYIKSENVLVYSNRLHHYYAKIVITTIYYQINIRI